jgi:hypothetical protein
MCAKAQGCAAGLSWCIVAIVHLINDRHQEPCCDPIGTDLIDEVSYHQQCRLTCFSVTETTAAEAATFVAIGHWWQQQQQQRRRHPHHHHQQQQQH